MNATPKIEIRPIDDPAITCNCCEYNDSVSDNVFELRFKFSNFTQCIVLCGRHLDELRQTIFVAQIELNG